MVASSAAIEQFVDRHDAVGLVPHPRLLEDMALGYWLAHAARTRNITYATLVDFVADFNCFLPAAGLKAARRAANVVLHGAKSREAHLYIWTLLAHNDAAHNQSDCIRRTRFAHVGGGIMG